jgi:hypothetical protein
LFKSHASKKFLRPYLEENPQQKQDSGVTQVVRALTIKHEDLSSNSTAVKKKKKKRLLHASVEVLWARVKGPCLHRPGNCLMRQLTDKLKPVYKVGFIIEKGKASARHCRKSVSP